MRHPLCAAPQEDCAPVDVVQRARVAVQFGVEERSITVGAGRFVEKAVDIGHLGPQIASATQHLTAQAGVKACHQQRGGHALATDVANRDAQGVAAARR